MLIPFDVQSPAAQRRFRTNQAALATIAPALISALGQPGSFPPNLLTRPASAEKPVNFEWQGGLFYADDASRLALQQVDAFAAADQSFVPGVATYSAADEIAFDRIQALDRAFGDTLMATPRAYTVPPRYGATITVFGIGLGSHIPTLLDRFDVLHLVLYESDPAIFRASLFTIDWDKIVRRFRETGRSLTVIVDPDPAGSASAILGALQQLPPALIVGSRYFRLYSSPTMDQAAGSVAAKLRYLGFGWGYFKDERRQILHTRDNMALRHRWLRRRWPALPDADAVVVGAGPSLDRTLPLLRQIRDRVVVFSSGSAIRPLARAGIEPDFHVELETGPLTTDILKEIGDQTLFDRVTLLVSNGMVPSALSIFRTTHLFARENSTSSFLIGAAADPIPNCYPVVGNSAVGLAYTLGFRRITLFGVDFGYRDKGRHHAAGTIYVDDASGRVRTDLSEIGLGHVELSDYTDTRHHLPSTTGDELLADDTFASSLLAMEHFLATKPDLRLIQCGDGARVNRALNWTPDDFGSLSYTGDRRSTLGSLADRFDAAPIDEAEYRRRMASLAEEFDRLARRLKRLYGETRPEAIDYARKISQTWEILNELRRISPAVTSILFGAFSSYLKATVERSFMTSSHADQVRFVRLAQTHFTLLLDDLSAGLASFREGSDYTSPRNIAS